MKDIRTFGQRAADKIAGIGRSWPFLFALNAFIMGWAVLNEWEGARALDPFPFILLNLFLSWLASIQAPIIMMSQGRQDEMQRKTVADIAAIAAATYEIASATRELLIEQSERDNDNERHS